MRRSAVDIAQEIVRMPPGDVYRLSMQTLQDLTYQGMDDPVTVMLRVFAYSSVEFEVRENIKDMNIEFRRIE